MRNFSLPFLIIEVLAALGSTLKKELIDFDDFHGFYYTLLALNHSVYFLALLKGSKTKRLPGQTMSSVGGK